MPDSLHRFARLGAAALALSLFTTGLAFAQDDAPAEKPAEKPGVATPTGDEPRVTGIGGLFFKAENARELAEWYRTHLGITRSETGYLGFTWRDRAEPERVGYTSWAAFKHDTTYFAPSNKDFMFNYRVNDLDGLLEKLRDEGVEIVGEIQRTDYGDFGWILDPEGTKIELWEAVDLVVPVDEKTLPGEVIDPNAAEVRAALKDYYEDFSARDWEKFAADFHEGAIMSTIWAPGEDGEKVIMSTIPQFIKRAPMGPGSRPVFEERMTAVSVQMQGNLAQAWARYEATFGEEGDLAHWSGIDAFTLLKFEGTWKIVSVAYVTVENDS